MEVIGTENKRLKEGQDRYKYTREHPMEKKFRETNEENLKYFTGEDQGWDKYGDRSKLEKEGRPAITMNRIQALIRLICETRPKLETTYLPVGGNDSYAADVFRSCKDHIEHQNKWEYKENDWFKYFAIMNRSVVSIMPSYRLDVRGEVELKIEDGYRFYLDWDAVQKDRSDGMYLFYVPGISKEEAYRLWPGKKDEVDRFIGQVEGFMPTQTRDTSQSDGYKDPQGEFYNAETKKLFPVYYWYKEFEKATKIIDKATNRVYESKKSKAETENSLKTIDGADRFSVIERDYIRVKYIVFLEDIVFEEGVTPWEREDGQRTMLSENFPYIIAEPEILRFGVQQRMVEIIESLKDPQMYHNKLASSILHIINSQAKTGLDYEDGAISEAELKKLEESGSKPGHNTKWNAGALSGGKVKPRGPTTMPNAEMAMANQMSKSLLDISGVEGLVSADSLGKNAPARAREMKYSQGANAIAWAYQSFSYFKTLLAEYERDAIQTLYNYEKIIRIRGQRNKPVKINEKVYDERGGIQKVLNDVTQGQYDVQVKEKASDLTQRTERLKYFSEMVKSGQIVLPPQVLQKVVMELMDDVELRDLVEEELGKFMEEQAQQPKQQNIKEIVDLDRLYPLLARSEQAQLLQQFGIQPDMNAKVAGLPDANSLIDLQKTREQSAHKEKIETGEMVMKGMEQQPSVEMGG